jgi:adenylosuccinate lyase
VIERYTRPAMGRVWGLEERFAKMLVVEQAAAEAQASLGLIPKAAALDIRKKSKFSLERILELEKTTKHDVIAFVSNVAENIGPNGRYLHFGLTSSDVIDTAMSLLTRDAGEVLLASIARLKKSLEKKVKDHSATLMAGRTHGMHAEPTTFGMKMASFFAELKRGEARVERALKQMEIAKLSGAVGTFSMQTSEVEKHVAKALGLECETIATQVIPRDRHAEMIVSLALLGGGLERLAVELRHLQRTEVMEAIEGFTPGQKGSSAMPHKKNPISSENITGCARLLRGYAQAAMEDIALWHERDISHSAVERVIFPDAFILADYSCDRMATVLDGLFVDEKRMRENMNLSQGQLFSSHLLLALVEKGLSREEAYKQVQALSHGLKVGENLKAKALKDPQMRKLFQSSEIERVFSGEKHIQGIQKVLQLGKPAASSKKQKGAKR